MCVRKRRGRPLSHRRPRRCSQPTRQPRQSINQSICPSQVCLGWGEPVPGSIHTTKAKAASTCRRRGREADGCRQRRTSRSEEERRNDADATRGFTCVCASIDCSQHAPQQGQGQAAATVESKGRSIERAVDSQAVSILGPLREETSNPVVIARLDSAHPSTTAPNQLTTQPPVYT